MVVSTEIAADGWTSRFKQWWARIWMSRENKITNELRLMELEGEIVRCVFCKRWRLPGTECDCFDEQP